MLEYQAKRWNIKPLLNEQKSCIRVNILVHLWVKTIDTTNYLNHLRIFGCVMFVRINKYKIKWSPTSLCYVFIGYDFCQNSCCFCPKNKIIIFKDVIFEDDHCDFPPIVMAKRWVQVKVNHFLHHTASFCIMSCINMSLTCHKIIIMPFPLD
jgi:hypothetical protein